MNGLVRELAEQARAVPIGGAPRERALVGYENIEKFADLILFECVKIAVFKGDTATAKEIKEHFGLK
jgi:hypothetical protein